jgi:hypothetical protein
MGRACAREAEQAQLLSDALNFLERGIVGSPDAGDGQTVVNWDWRDKLYMGISKCLGASKPQSQLTVRGRSGRKVMRGRVRKSTG